MSINVLELLGMVLTAYVMIVIRGEVADREGEAVLMRGDNASAVQWVLNCKGGKDDVMEEEEKEKCSEILRGDTRSDELRHRLDRLMRELGGCG